MGQGRWTRKGRGGERKGKEEGKRQRRGKEEVCSRMAGVCGERTHVLRDEVIA